MLLLLPATGRVQKRGEEVVDNCSVLFVCSGNTCRSVMAEAFFPYYWELAGIPGKLYVCSAGLATVEGLAASRETLLLLRSEGLAMEHHRSRPLDAAMVEKAAYIFTMTAAQKQYILERFPNGLNKVWTLGEYGADGIDIADPYGGGLEDYKMAAIQIKQALLGITARLKSER